MQGQGCIVGVGALEYPAAFAYTPIDTLNALHISKQITLSSTYDHRIIQGAESGEFLKYAAELLQGEHEFYEELFSGFSIPFAPSKPAFHAPQSTHSPSPLAQTTPHPNTQGEPTPVPPFTQSADQSVKDLLVSRLIEAYRTHGHKVANTNPLTPKRTGKAVRYCLLWPHARGYGAKF